MACYFPIRAYRGKRGSNGKRSIVFRPSSAEIPGNLQLPCGRCIGCRLERSRQWAVRCVHEASLFERNCFITLTYDDSHLPAGGSLDVRAFQRFIKRLRKRFGSGVRYFHCGEYGSQLSRPHYHACLFNFDFDDKVLWKVQNGFNLYRSPVLEELWPFGFSLVGEVTFESAAYVARYIMKKVTGEAASSHYEGKAPEYVTMSRRPGIGRDWYRQFKRDVYPGDFVFVNGAKCKPPVFYDRLLELDDKLVYDEVLARRVSVGRSRALDNDSFRLPVKEECLQARIKSLVRPLEEVL